MKGRPKFMLVAMIAITLLYSGVVVAATYSDPVGFVKLDLNEDAYNMIAIPLLGDYALNDTDPNSACVGEMLAENLNGGPDAYNAPNIYLYTGSGFLSAFLFDVGVPAHPLHRKWVDAGISTKVLDGKSGYYLERQSGDGGAAIEKAVILGDVEVAATVTLNLAAGYNLITYPYPIDVMVNDPEFCHLADGGTGGSDAYVGDNVYKYTGAGFLSAFLFDVGVPAHPLHDKWVDAGASTLTFYVGEGFFYEAQNAFSWVVAKPY